MYSVKKNKIFAFVCLFTATLHFLISFISRFPFEYVHISSILLRDIIPIVCLIVFYFMFFFSKKGKLRFSIVPLVIEQLSLASSYLMYYTRENIQPWTWHISFSVNNLINFIPYVTFVIVMFFMLFSALKSLRAVILCFITAYVPEIIRTAYNLTNGNSFKFPYPLFAQMFLLVSLVFLYLLLSKEKQNISQQDYDLSSIADSLKENYSTGNDNITDVKIATEDSTETILEENTLSNISNIDDNVQKSVPLISNTQNTETTEDIQHIETQPAHQVTSTTENNDLQRVKPLSLNSSNRTLISAENKNKLKKDNQNDDSIQKVSAVILPKFSKQTGSTSTTNQTNSSQENTESI